MARTKLETQTEQTIITEEDLPGLPQAMESINELASAEKALMANFETIKCIGRIEASQFYATVAEKLIVETAINIRESKKYKGLPYKNENGQCATVATFDEFCQIFLGKSARRVQELISNYNQLGPNLYEQAEKIGFRQRDYNALKALPADDRQLIAQAIEEESLEKALDILQEMAAKHQREKTEMVKKVDELAQTIEAKDKVIKDKTGLIDNQAEKLALFENRQKSITAEQALVDARNNLQVHAANVKAQVMSQLRSCMRTLHQQPGDHGAFAGGCLIEIKRELDILRDEYNLPVTVTEDLTPDWMKPEVMAKIDAEYGESGTIQAGGDDQDTWIEE